MSRENKDTHDRILNAAWKLLEENQGKDVRMIDIARKAGISRQALYLHFSKRSELLVATTRYLDQIKNTENRLIASRTAKSGVKRLSAFIEAWGNYIPEVYGVARALLAMKDTDDDAAIAWNDRMQAVRQGCEAAVKALQSDGVLVASYSTKQATDVLWTLLSVRHWEQLTIECGWPQKTYIKRTKEIAHQILVDQ